MKQLSDLQLLLGIKFDNLKLLEQALTHRSFLNEDKSSKISNERLEFLGDSVLSILTSTRLYKDFEDLPEGELTSQRSALVKTKTLASVALEMGLGEYLFLSRGEERSGGRENTSLLADTFEAILGAVYLDSGLDQANLVLQKWLFPKIGEIKSKDLLGDFKSKLQELIQSQSKLSPSYKVVAELGPDHDKTFTVMVLVRDEELARGNGKSKQEAEQAAAKLAIEKLSPK